MADLMVGLGSFEPPLAEAAFHASHLEFLLEEIDLTAEQLALLVHGVVSIDLCHKTPVVDSEFVEFSTECGVGGSAPTEGGYKPHGQGPGGVVVVIVIVFFWGVKVGN